MDTMEPFSSTPRSRSSPQFQAYGQFPQQDWLMNVEASQEEPAAPMADPMPMRRSESANALAPTEEDELPLLEELGISFADIWSKTKLVLRPMKDMDEHVVDDADLAGPIVFGLCLGAVLLLRGKVHFGYIYGFGVCSCVGTYFVLSLMAPPEADLSFSHVVSFLGYCLLPVVVLAAIALVIKLTGPLGTSLAATCVLACTLPCTRLFETKLNARHQRFLIAYPLALIYSCFVLITIF